MGRCAAMVSCSPYLQAPPAGEVWPRGHRNQQRRDSPRRVFQADVRKGPTLMWLDAIPDDACSFVSGGDFRAQIYRAKCQIKNIWLS